MGTTPVADEYDRWIEQHDTLTDEDRRLIARHMAMFDRRPIISVVMPAYDTPPPLLRQAIASVRGQIYPDWQLCVVDDASPSGDVVSILEELSAEDPRILWARQPVNGHIAAASNMALSLATGEFVALMDHDDVLPKHALYEVAAELQDHPDADVIYSDEDQIAEDGRRSSPYFKPDWNPELLTGHNLVSHLGVYRRSLLEQIGGFREGFEGSQDWDLALRATAATGPDKIRHIPSVLYHWRRNSGVATFSESWMERCHDAGRRAVRDWLAGEGLPKARVEPHHGWNRVIYPVPEPKPLVSVVLPPLDPVLLGRACDGLFYGTDWPEHRLDVIVTDHRLSQTASELWDQLRRHPRVRMIGVGKSDNVSAVFNQGTRVAAGEVVVLMGAVEPAAPGWLSSLIGLALRREVGAVGAKVIDPAGRVEHAGLVLGPGPRAGPILKGAAPDDSGYAGQLILTRALSAVTGGCIALRREVLEEAGGFDETLSAGFNDLDLCLRLQDLGYRVVWSPDVLLRRTGGPQWLPTENGPEWGALGRRWGLRFDCDPYHNPNLRLWNGKASLAHPAYPRRWRGLVAAPGRSSL